MLPFSACSEFEYEGFLNQPVPIEVIDGQPIARISFGDQTNVRALIDSGSPINVLQQNARAVALPDGSLVSGSVIINLSRVTGDLSLLDGAQPDIVRFSFKEQEVLDLPVNPVGLTTPVSIRGVLGFSLLSNFSVHLSYETDATITLRDLITDTNGELAEDCDSRRLLTAGGFASERCLAVVSSEPKGGGTFLLGNEELQLPASRVVVPMCLVPEAFDPTSDEQIAPTATTGTPVSALMATGLGISLISESAFARLQATSAEPLTPSASTEIHLPSGTETVRLVSIPRVAVVSDQTFDLGPCGELARRRRLLLAPRVGIAQEDQNHLGAAVAITPAAVQFAIIADSSPLLQGPRQELGSLTSDVDVLLGGSFLSLFELDLDYPSTRVILQCRRDLAADTCRTMSFCSQSDPPRCPDKESE